MRIPKSPQDRVHPSLVSGALGLEPCQDVVIDPKCNLSLAWRYWQTLMSDRVGPVLWRSPRSVFRKQDLRIRQEAKLLPVSIAFSDLFGSAATMLRVP